LATGDELVEPGGEPNSDQINSSNNYALKAMIDAAGGHARLLPIARDNADSLRHSFELAHGADVLLTLGGASVGDYDLVATVGQEAGLDLSFYKVAMRPGKPLMAGRINGTPMIGLPGNPVSSIVCAHVLLRPALNVMLGLGRSPLLEQTGVSGSELRSNGPRQHYLRASVELVDGQIVVTSAERQDSSLLSVMSASNALLVRVPNEGPVSLGDPVRFIRL
jgi:molybdopterin molybdotransferase